jgi:hypothetical protein
MNAPMELASMRSVRAMRASDLQSSPSGSARNIGWANSKVLNSPLELFFVRSP